MVRWGVREDEEREGNNGLVVSEGKEENGKRERERERERGVVIVGNKCDRDVTEDITKI